MALIKIENGPSKFDVSIALFHAPLEAESHYVQFTLEDRGKVRLTITAAEWEGGKRDRFLIKGHLVDDDGLIVESFDGAFNFQSRTGYIVTP